MNTQKKIVSLFFVIALVAVSCWNVYQSKQQVTFSDLVLENIEALARNEIEDYYNFHLVSYSSGCKICEWGGTWCNVHDQEPC